MEQLILRNSVTELILAPSGALRSMRNLITGVECLFQPHDTPVFSLICARADGTTLATEAVGLPSVARSSGTDLRMEWPAIRVGDVDIPIVIRLLAVLRDDSPESIWHIEVENRTRDWTVSEVIFPRISGLRLASGEDVLILPNQTGDRIPNPLEELRLPAEVEWSHWKYKVPRPVRGHPSAYHRGGEDGLEFLYCGQASMAWMDYHDDEQGVYLASYEGEPRVTGIGAAAHQAPVPHMDLYLRRYPVVKPGDAWRSGEFGFATHSGDWHWGADRYREVVSPRLPSPPVPEWFAERHGLVAHYDFKFQDGEIRHKFAEMPDLVRKAQASGLDQLLIAGWSTGGFDTLNPVFYPDIELGSASEFPRSIQAAKNAGGRVSFYINSRLFNMRTDGYDTSGLKWAVKDPSGEPSKETYGRETFSTMCPACREWTDLVAGYAKWLLGDAGASGVYVDQIGALPRLCYDSGHGHESPDRWTEGYVQMLKDIRAFAETLAEMPMVLMEGCGDAYGPHVTAQLTHSGWNYYSPYVHPQIYKYTFPQFTHLDMILPKPLPLEPAGSEDDVYDIVAREFLVGAYFWIYDHCLENSEVLAYLKAVIALREAGKKFFTSGTFEDTVGLRLSDPSIEGSTFRSGDDRLVIFRNPLRHTGAQAAVDIVDTPNVMIETHTLEGDTVTARQEFPGTTIRIAVPESPLSIAILTVNGG